MGDHFNLLARFETRERERLIVFTYLDLHSGLNDFQGEAQCDGDE